VWQVFWDTEERQEGRTTVGSQKEKTDSQSDASGFAEVMTQRLISELVETAVEEARSYLKPSLMMFALLVPHGSLRHGSPLTWPPAGVRQPSCGEGEG
jgi:hypothetical protein